VLVAVALVVLAEARRINPVQVELVAVLMEALEPEAPHLPILAVAVAAVALLALALPLMVVLVALVLSLSNTQASTA
jgi:hypothetical protein